MGGGEIPRADTQTWSIVHVLAVGRVPGQKVWWFLSGLSASEKSKLDMHDGWWGGLLGVGFPVKPMTLLPRVIAQIPLTSCLPSVLKLRSPAHACSACAKRPRRMIF